MQGNDKLVTRYADVLLFAEDPGAANFVVELPRSLAAIGFNACLLATGVAAKYLPQYHVEFSVVPDDCDARRLLQSILPRLVVVGTSENSDSLGLQLILEARAANLPSVGVADQVTNCEFRFRGRTDDPLAYAPDWLLVPDEPTRQAYLALGYCEHRIVTCGHPWYDVIRSDMEVLQKKGQREIRAKLLPDLPGNRPVVAFIAEVSTGLDETQYRRSIDYTLSGKGNSSGRTEIVLEEFLEAVKHLVPRPYLVLRLHPKNREEEFARYLDEFDKISRTERPLDMVFAANYVVGMSSMLMMEAALIGRPTLSILPRPLERSWLASIAMGLTTCVTRREELVGAIANMLQESERPNKPPIFDDGLLGSLARTTNFLRELLTGSC
ncbi:MAG: hypothetical protein JO356_14930 [Acidobacteria bacterium]|nr:hypothetical protein [Acidobacteriota bacterium]